jgi:hypothetical protein
MIGEPAADGGLLGSLRRPAQRLKCLPFLCTVLRDRKRSYPFNIRQGETGGTTREPALTLLLGLGKGKTRAGVTTRTSLGRGDRQHPQVPLGPQIDTDIEFWFGAKITQP